MLVVVPSFMPMSLFSVVVWFYQYLYAAFAEICRQQQQQQQQ